MEEWKAFWEQHDGVVGFIEATCEGFWEGLSEVLTRMEETRWTTRGAVVRDIPRAVDAATQTSAATQRDREVQTGPEGHRTVGTQTEPESAPRRQPLRWEETHYLPGRSSKVATSPRDSRVERVGPRAGFPPMPRGCWNCGEIGHRYTRCTRLTTQFCYGCGVPGVTVSTCPRCGPGYSRTGPYSGQGGPRDRVRARRSPSPKKVRVERTLYLQGKEPSPDSDDSWNEWRRPR